MSIEISKELLCEVLTKTTNQRYFYISNIQVFDNILSFIFISDEGFNCEYKINIYELAHLNLKQWAKIKNVFDIIDWSEEPEQIFAKAEGLRNELDKRPRGN